MHQAGKCAQISIDMKRSRLRVLIVSETHWIQSGQKHLMSRKQILNSGLDDNQHLEGVALLCSMYAQKFFRGQKLYGERIIMTSLTVRSKNINMTVM